MTELRPILQGRPTRGEMRILGSARLDSPRPGGVARTVAALGLASGVTATAGVSAASASSAGGALIVKWLAIGAATGVVVTGTGEAVRYGIESVRTVPALSREVRSGPRLEARPVDSRPVARSIPVAPPADPEPGATKAFDSELPPARPRPPSSAPAREPAPAPAFAPAPTLSDEVRALDGVRAHLAAGNASAALAGLETFSRRFSSPRLGPEANLLRAQALEALGRTGKGTKP